MGCVQETLFDKALLEGQGSLKFHYSARRPLATQKLRKKYEIFIPKFGRQSAEKKTACDNGDLGETNPVLLALAVPEVGMFMRKISCCPQGAPEASSDGRFEVPVTGECRRMDNFPIAGDLTAPFSLSCCHPEPKAKDLRLFLVTSEWPVTRPEPPQPPCKVGSFSGLSLRWRTRGHQDCRLRGKNSPRLPPSVPYEVEISLSGTTQCVLRSRTSP